MYIVQGGTIKAIQVEPTT